MQHYDGPIQIGLICATLLVLAVRLAYENQQQPTNHAVIIAGAFFASTLVYRIADVLQHLDSVRWSGVMGTAGLLVFLGSDPRFVQHYSHAWRTIAGQHRRGHRADEEA